MRKPPDDRGKFVPGPPGDHRYVHPLSTGFSQKNAIKGYNWKDEDTYCYPGGVEFASWLAWEALRRNVFFQRYCDENDPNSENSWNDDPKPYEWGLARFKHYAAPIVKAEPATWPDWTVLRSASVIDFASPYEVSKLSPNTKRTAKPSKGSRRQFMLEAGQVAVVFDLEQAKHFKSMLDRQIHESLLKLRTIVAVLHNDSDFAGVREKPQEDTVIRLLRVADAMLETPRPPPAEVAAVVFPKMQHPKEAHGGEGLDPKNLSRKVESAAGLIYRQGYLGLLVRDK